MPSMKQKKVAIVTGASRGIGKAIALKLDREGFITVLVSRHSENLKTALKDFKKNAVAIPADVSKEKEVVAMVGEVIKKFGRIDVLINNAGFSAFKRINQLTKEDFDQTINTNLGGAFYCLRECISQMKKQPQGGQIINISSIAAKAPFLYPGRSLHCASKAAIGNLANSIQAEMISERRNIKIATIYPGVVFTEWFFKRKTRDLDEVKKNALKPEDIAHVVWMIVSQGRNSNITEVLIEPISPVSLLSKPNNPQKDSG